MRKLPRKLRPKPETRAALFLKIRPLPARAAENFGFPPFDRPPTSKPRRRRRRSLSGRNRFAISIFRFSWLSPPILFYLHQTAVAADSAVSGARDLFRLGKGAQEVFAEDFAD